MFTHLLSCSRGAALRPKPIHLQILGWQGAAGEALGAVHTELLGTEVLGRKRSQVTLNKEFLVLS